MDEDAMWKNFYEKLVVEKQNDEQKSEHQIRIQESDGNFFENLGTLLADKVRAQEQTEEPIPKVKECQEVKEVDTSSIDESIAEEPSTAILETDSDRDEHEHALNFLVESVGLNIEELYSALAYMVQHQIGHDISNNCSQEELLNHLQQVFKMNNETHEKILEETKNMEAPELRLNIEVIEAKEVVPKDSNGKSDPFCALYLKSIPTRRYNTAVKTETLSPVWEEHFELPLEDPENDVLCLEVWDFDAAETVPEKIGKVRGVKGVRGLVKLAKEIAVTATNGNHNNELIGKCQISLKEIPSTGHTMWYNLEKKNKAKRRGLIKLRLSFTTEHNTQVAAQEHRHLLRLLLLHEIEQEKVEKYCWCDKWSAPSRALIVQHSAQRGLVARNLILSEWAEYSRIHQEHPLSFTVFNKLGIELFRPMENSLFSPDETRLFWDATKKLLYSCFNSLRKIRKFNPEDKNSINQLSAILGILSTIADLKIPDDLDLFPPRMYSWFPEPDGSKIDILTALEFTVIRGAAEWFDHVTNNSCTEGETDEDAIRYHIKVVQLITADVKQAMHHYDKIFIGKINFPYARTLYVTYEKRISDLCTIIVEDVCARLKHISVDSDDIVELQLGTTLFELYHFLRKYAELGPELCTENQLEYMKIQTYHQWFRTGVAHWLEISVYKAIKRIERAVNFDTLERIDTNVEYSSSAVDTLTIYYQIKVFWTQMAWPDVEESYTFLAKIIDDICKCSIFYADKMAEKAETTTELEQLSERSSVYDRKFTVSTAWCFAINNIHYIWTSIRPLTNDLGFESIIEALAEQKTQEDADRCRQTLQLLIDNATDSVKTKIIELMQVVGNKMAPAINRYLMEGAELIDTTSNAMDRIFQYLDGNIITLRENLNDDNFGRILLVIWEILSKTLYDLVRSNLEKRRPPSFYSNLHRTLHTLIGFFNLGADETSNIQVLEKIEELLTLHGMETTQLIHRYHQERVIEQKKLEESVYGLLTVKAQFNSNHLTIQILNARNLQPMDNNGKSDPYVKIRLLPENKFIEVKSPKTHVQKETLFPLFDDIFNIPLTEEQRRTEGAIVMFEIKDKDFLRSRFMAEAFLPFDEIPQTDSDQTIHTVDQIHLNLSRPINRTSDVYRALEHRKGDNQAIDFICKLNNRINEK